MVNILFVEADGTETNVDATIGDTLMLTAKAGGVGGVVAECGGSMACGTCHVYLEENIFRSLSAPSTMEADMIEYALAPRATSRLSCQIEIVGNMDGMRVEVPEAQL